MLSSTSTMTGIGSEPMTGLAYVASVAGHYAACFALLNSAVFISTTRAAHWSKVKAFAAAAASLALSARFAAIGWKKQIKTR
jgi:hypothetical protein